MRVAFAVAVLLLLVACKSNTAVKSDDNVSVDERSAKLEQATNDDFVDEHAEYEYFNLDQYIVDAKDVPADSIANISETCFVKLIRIEIKEFEDEDSEEAQDYFTAMDDLMYYMHESTERMRSLNISELAVSLRFVRFDIEGSDPIVVDTEKQEASLSMLLYKKGEKPLVIDITDGNTDRLKAYLGIN